VREAAARRVQDADMAQAFFYACGAVSLVGLVVAARDDLTRALLLCLFVGAGIALAMTLPTVAARLAGFLVAMACGYAARRVYDARRPNRSRTRR
jgi:flagellar biosynthesis protein FliR